MTIRTGAQYGLPHASALAVLGRCLIPRGPSGFGPEEGLAFAVEVDAATAVSHQDRPRYQHLVVRSILALLRHDISGRFADFDPTVLTMVPPSGLCIWQRLIFRTKSSPYGNFESNFRMLGQRISWAWTIADWVTKVEGTDGHGKAEKEDCPIRPIDVVCQALDGSIAELAPEELRYEVRRWCERPVDLRNRWQFGRYRHKSPLHSNAGEWLIDEGFLVQDEKNEMEYCFTEKFVLMCWKDAMSNLA